MEKESSVKVSTATRALSFGSDGFDRCIVNFDAGDVNCVIDALEGTYKLLNGFRLNDLVCCGMIRDMEVSDIDCVREAYKVYKKVYGINDEEVDGNE